MAIVELIHKTMPSLEQVAKSETDNGTSIQQLY